MEQFGIYQVSIPLPIWNDSVHCYLARTEGKWVVVDTGINGHVTQETWEAAFTKHGISPGNDISRIYLTHHHADHFGFAGVMQEWTNAPLYLSDREEELSRFTWSKEGFSTFYRSCGLPEAMVSELVGNPTASVKPITPYPHMLERIEAGDRFQVGELNFEAMLMPGHTPGHICYYNADEKILISGDHFTKETIPYISYHGYGDENPLATFLTTLRKMQEMEISQVWPGHGPVFHDAQERIEELIQHYQARMAIVMDHAKGEKTAYELAESLFQKELPTFNQWIILGETNAYLRYLVGQGELEGFESNGILHYKKKC